MRITTGVWGHVHKLLLYQAISIVADSGRHDKLQRL
jgi:hypothetical protein